MGKEKKKSAALAAASTGGGHAKERHRRAARYHPDHRAPAPHPPSPTVLPGLDGRLPKHVPQSKHRSYLEFVENKDKKKKLEFEVTTKRDPPAGFEFVPLGNPDLTTACKEISRENDAMIFIVSDAKYQDDNGFRVEVNRIGHHIRKRIVDEARASLGQAPESFPDPRDEDVPEPIPESQEQINAQAEAHIRDLFPRMPYTDRQLIIEHSFRKDQRRPGKQTVGLAPGLRLARRVQLAVVAHVRHTHTRYDQLLRETDWARARKAVESVCLDVLAKWRGDEETGRDQLDEILREVIVISDDEESDGDADSDDDYNDSDADYFSEVEDDHGRQIERPPRTGGDPGLSDGRRNVSIVPQSRVEARPVVHGSIEHDELLRVRLSPRDVRRMGGGQPRVKGFRRYAAQAARDEALQERWKQARERVWLDRPPALAPLSYPAPAPAAVAVAPATMVVPVRASAPVQPPAPGPRVSSPMRSVPPPVLTRHVYDMNGRVLEVHDGPSRSEYRATPPPVVWSETREQQPAQQSGMVYHRSHERVRSQGGLSLSRSPSQTDYRSPRQPSHPQPPPVDSRDIVLPSIEPRSPETDRSLRHPSVANNYSPTPSAYPPVFHRRSASPVRRAPYVPGVLYAALREREPLVAPQHFIGEPRYGGARAPTVQPEHIRRLADDQRAEFPRLPSRLTEPHVGIGGVPPQAPYDAHGMAYARPIHQHPSLSNDGRPLFIAESRPALLGRSDSPILRTEGRPIVVEEWGLPGSERRPYLVHDWESTPETVPVVPARTPYREPAHQPRFVEPAVAHVVVTRAPLTIPAHAPLSQGPRHDRPNYDAPAGPTFTPVAGYYQRAPVAPEPVPGHGGPVPQDQFRHEPRLVRVEGGDLPVGLEYHHGGHRLPGPGLVPPLEFARPHPSQGHLPPPRPPPQQPPY